MTKIINFIILVFFSNYSFSYNLGELFVTSYQNQNLSSYIPLLPDPDIKMDPSKIDIKIYEGQKEDESAILDLRHTLFKKDHNWFIKIFTTAEVGDEPIDFIVELNNEGYQTQKSYNISLSIDPEILKEAPEDPTPIKNMETELKTEVSAANPSYSYLVSSIVIINMAIASLLLMLVMYKWIRGAFKSKFRHSPWQISKQRLSKVNVVEETIAIDNFELQEFEPEPDLDALILEEQLNLAKSYLDINQKSEAKLILEELLTKNYKIKEIEQLIAEV